MKNILFLGNSFTFVNDLPGMLAGLFRDGGFACSIDAVLRGGAYLHQFTDPADELSGKLREKIAGQTWDIVVLQDQSANPALDPADHVEACRKIAALFPETTSFLLYQTWSYRDHTEKLRSVHLSYEAMRTALRDGYTAAADALHGTVVPVGDVFAAATAAGVDVYTPDDYHPSPAGTYLAACLFHRALTGKLPASAPASLSPEEGAALRTIADAV